MSTAYAMLWVLVLLQLLGVALFLAGVGWGLLLLVAIAAIVQMTTLILAWHTFKLTLRLKEKLDTLERDRKRE